MAEQNRRTNRPFITDPNTGRPRKANLRERARLRFGDSDLQARQAEAMRQRNRNMRQRQAAAEADQARTRSTGSSEAAARSNTTQAPSQQPIRGQIDADRRRLADATERAEIERRAEMDKERGRNIRTNAEATARRNLNAEDARRAQMGGVSGQRSFVNAARDTADDAARTLRDTIDRGGEFVRTQADRVSDRFGNNTNTGGNTTTPNSGNAATSATPEGGPNQPRSVTRTLANAGGKGLNLARKALTSRAALLGLAGTAAYNMWPDGDDDRVVSTQGPQGQPVQATSGPDPEAPRTGPDGTPLPTSQEAGNPNAQITNEGYAVPTGEGDRLPFGRTPQVQNQIDQNVAGIDRTTAAIRENNNLRREMVGGRQTGTDREGTPEQRQIRDLVKQMRSGSIGDRNRNNVIAQQIAALQGVDTANVTRENTRATTQAGLREALMEQQQLMLERADAAREAETAEAQYINEALADPEQARVLDQYLASTQAGGQMSPAQRSALLERVRRQGGSRLPSVGAFFDNEDVDPTNPSVAGAERISGGGFFGDLIGYGPGYEFADGTKVRSDNLNDMTQRMLDEAIRRDNPRAR